MNEVYIELYLLDNALMNYLVLKAAEPICGERLKGWLAAVACAVGAACAALALTEPFFVSLPAKALLLALMSAAFWPVNIKTALRCAAGVLAATFVLGGVAYAAAGVFSGAFFGGVLYASVSLRAVLVTAAAALFLPRNIRRLVAVRRLRSEVNVLLTTKAASACVAARIDTGNTLVEPFTGLPVVVVSGRKAEALFDGKQTEYAVGYSSVGGEGVLKAVRAEAWTEEYGRRACVIALSPVALVGTEAIVNAELFAA